MVSASVLAAARKPSCLYSVLHPGADYPVSLQRAEHNDGMLSNLKEVTLHQQNIEKIEVVGNVCRQLQILYLQNNVIGRIENLHHLKVEQ